MRTILMGFNPPPHEGTLSIAQIISHPVQPRKWDSFPNKNDAMCAWALWAILALVFLCYVVVSTMSYVDGLYLPEDEEQSWAHGSWQIATHPSKVVHAKEDSKEAQQICVEGKMYSWISFAVPLIPGGPCERGKSKTQLC